MKKFTDLEVWKVGIEILKGIYALSHKLPKEELFGITSQMRRASVSVLANTAEGFGRYTYADKANRFTIARGECNELEAYLYSIVALEFMTANDTEPMHQLIDQEEKLLSGLISSCRKRS